jgi:hypothetical protein
LAAVDRERSEVVSALSIVFSSLCEIPSELERTADLTKERLIILRWEVVLRWKLAKNQETQGEGESSWQERRGEKGIDVWRESNSFP